MPPEKLSGKDLSTIIDRLESTPLKVLSSEFNINRATIYRRVKKFKETGLLDRHPRKKQKCKLSDSQLEDLKNFYCNNPFAKDEEAKQALNLNVSTTTIGRCLKKLNLLKAKSPNKFYIKPIKREERIIFASRHKYWTVDQWKKVVFTDESHIDNSGPRSQPVVRPRGKRFDPAYIYTAPNKTLRYNFFSWVSIHGTGDLIFYNRMDSVTYCEILPRMIENLKEKFGSEDFYIIHDNARFSTSKYTMQFIKENNYEKYFINIPPYSPDVNIIENCWAILKRKVRKHCFKHGQTTNQEEFQELAQRKWKSISSVIMSNLYTSLPVRMREILSVEGNLARY